jgi:4-hydroxy-3-methylbut-2-enyl diphosphate reductase
VQVIKASEAGFCSGVRRAVETAFRTAGKGGGRFFTLGPLIHNDTVLAKLAEQGFSVLNEDDLPQSLEGDTVIIRTHGIKPALQAEICCRGANIIDATCQKVKANQLKARELSENGFFLWIAGEKYHAEVQGLLGFAPKAQVISSAEDAKTLAGALFSCNSAAKTAIIAQTTISNIEFEVICGTLRHFFPDLAIYNTICTATLKRQQALQDLCAKVEAVLIAGDPKSSNTRRLLEIAQNAGRKAWIVSAPEDIPAEIYAFKTVGLSAGASTPDEVITAIQENIRAAVIL